MILLLALLMYLLVGPTRNGRAFIEKWSNNPSGCIPMPDNHTLNGHLPKVTPWYDCGLYKPVRDGWYDVLYAGEKEIQSAIYRRWWSKEHSEWFFSDAEISVSMFGLLPDDKWRGLTRPVK